MAQQGKQADEGFESYFGTAPGAKGAVPIEGQTAIHLRVCRHAEQGLPFALSRSQTGIKEGKRPIDVQSWFEFRDESIFNEQGFGLGRNRFVDERMCLFHDSPHLSMCLLAAGVSIVLKATFQVFGLAHIDHLPLIIEIAIDPGCGRNRAEKLLAEFLVESCLGHNSGPKHCSTCGSLLLSIVGAVTAAIAAAVLFFGQRGAGLHPKSQLRVEVERLPTLFSLIVQLD